VVVVDITLAERLEGTLIVTGQWHTFSAGPVGPVAINRWLTRARLDVPDGSKGIAEGLPVTMSVGIFATHPAHHVTHLQVETQQRYR
jgi:hypothetical protein